MVTWTWTAIMLKEVLNFPFRLSKKLIGRIFELTTESIFCGYIGRLHVSIFCPTCFFFIAFLFKLVGCYQKHNGNFYLDVIAFLFNLLASHPLFCIADWVKDKATWMTIFAHTGERTKAGCEFCLHKIHHTEVSTHALSEQMLYVGSSKASKLTY